MRSALYRLATVKGANSPRRMSYFSPQYRAFCHQVATETRKIMKQMCPRCGWSDTRSSHRTGLDGVLELFWLDPFRCRSCNARFRRFRYAWARVLTPLLMMSFLCVIAGGVQLLNHERKVWTQKAKARAQFNAPKPLPKR